MKQSIEYIQVYRAVEIHLHQTALPSCAGFEPAIFPVKAGHPSQYQSQPLDQQEVATIATFSHNFTLTDNLMIHFLATGNILAHINSSPDIRIRFA